MRPWRKASVALSDPEYFQRYHLTNNETHNLDTRQRNNLYLPQANWTIYQKAAYYSGIKIFNNLPLEFKNVAGNQKKI